MIEGNHQSSARDFDFLIGSWQVTHQRLKARLCSCTEWVEFQGTCVAQKMLGGNANVDDNVLDLPTGSYRALSLRSFDASLKTWSIWWLDARSPGTLDVPVVGSFENGVGIFYAEDVLDGKAIRVRFQWHVAEPEKPRWEQAFSVDGGVNWESNWVMQFSRLT